MFLKFCYGCRHLILYYLCTFFCYMVLTTNMRFDKSIVVFLTFCFSYQCFCCVQGVYLYWTILSFWLRAPTVMGWCISELPLIGGGGVCLRWPEEAWAGVSHDRPGRYVPDSHAKQGETASKPISPKTNVSAHALTMFTPYRVFQKMEVQRFYLTLLARSRHHLPAFPVRTLRLQFSLVKDQTRFLHNRYCCKRVQDLNVD